MKEHFQAQMVSSYIIAQVFGLVDQQLQFLAAISQTVCSWDNRRSVK